MARSAEIGSLRVALGLDSAQFAAGAAKAQGSLQKLSGQFKAFAAGAIAALSFDRLAGAFQSITGHMDDLGKAAQKIGIPVDELSKLEYAAKLADVPLADLQSSIGKLSKGLAEFQATGKGAAGEALRSLGVSALTANGQLRPTSAILQDVAAKFATYEDGANKTALAMALFGKAGADMIPLLNGGREAIASAAQEAATFGAVVNQQAAAAAEQFNDNLTRLQTAGQGVANIVVQAMLPAMTDLTNQIVGYISSGDGAAKITAGIQSLMEQASATIRTTAQEVQSLAILLNTLGENFSKADGMDASIARWKKAFADIKQLKDSAAKNSGFLNPSAIDDVLSSIPSPGKGDREQVKKKPAPLVKGLVIPDLAKPVRELGKTADVVLPKIKPQMDAVARGATGIGNSIDAATGAMSDFGQEALQSLAGEFKGWIDSALSGTFKLKDALLGLASTLADIGINFFMNSFGSSVGGGGIGSIFKGLLGFAKGGTIMPGGSGGIDSQVVAFRKSPNERVDITTPGQRLTAGGSVAQVNINVSGARGNAEIEDMVRSGVSKGMAEVTRGEQKRFQEHNLRFT